MEKEELTPCDKCGGKPEVIKYWFKGSANIRHYFVRCSICKNRPTKYGYDFKKEAKAMENWNRSINDEIIGNIHENPELLKGE